MSKRGFLGDINGPGCDPDVGDCQHENLEATNEQKRRVDPKIENNFTYHAPKDDQPARYVAIREKAKELAYLIIESSKPSREQLLALTNLEQAVFWANAGIARNE